MRFSAAWAVCQRSPWVVLATTLLGKLAFKTSLDVAAPLAVAIILASSLLASVVSGLVAWAPTRVRPLEVLRYE